jgi:uridine kinase
LDRWIVPPEQRKDGLKGRYDLQAAATALEPWTSGRGTHIDLPYYDRFTRQNRAGDLQELPQDGVLIVEGVPAMLLPLSGTRSCHKIYVETDEASRSNRVIGDILERGHGNLEDARNEYQSREADEAILARQTGDDADVRITLDTIFSGQE